MSHFTIVTARGHQRFTTEGPFITGLNVQTSARTAEAARLAVFTIAGERDAEVVRGLRWAASMIFYMLKIRKPAPSAPAIVTLGVCDGWMNAHWNLSRELAKTPATVQVAGKKLCKFCAAEREKSIAAYNKLHEQKRPAAEYVPLIHAA